jgi:hypothetical protein
LNAALPLKKKGPGIVNPFFPPLTKADSVPRGSACASARGVWPLDFHTDRLSIFLSIDKQPQQVRVDLHLEGDLRLDLIRDGENATLRDRCPT